AGWGCGEVQVFGCGRSDEAAWEWADGGVKLIAWTQETPPIFLPTFIFLFHALRLDPLLDDREWLNVLGCLRFRPDLEVDDASLGSLERLVVEFIAIDDPANHLLITRISFDQPVSLSVREQEAIAEKDRALINTVGIFGEILGFPYIL
ncbi:MAG: hypothetical protein ACYCTW_04480, partial [Sulfuricella sp.]